MKPVGLNENGEAWIDLCWVGLTDARRSGPWSLRSRPFLMKLTVELYPCPVQENAEQFRKVLGTAGSQELVVFNAALNPIILVRSLYAQWLERTTIERSPFQVNLYHPAWIIQGFDPYPVPSVPISRCTGCGTTAASGSTSLLTALLGPARLCGSNRAVARSYFLFLWARTLDGCRRAGFVRIIWLGRCT